VLASPITRSRVLDSKARSLRQSRVVNHELNRRCYTCSLTGYEAGECLAH
jgi:hypothetical protein